MPDGRAVIIVASGNFHGRTTTIISFSDDPLAHDHFGPYTPVSSPCRTVILKRSATRSPMMLSPSCWSRSRGVRRSHPPPGYMAGVRELTSRHRVLFIADEIQSGLGRTGRTLALEHENVTADVYLLGKALGGGIVPVSAVVADHDVLGVLKPGQHGSTFGGNACLRSRAGRGQAAGDRPLPAARSNARPSAAGAAGPHGRARRGRVRSRGLWAGVDIDPSLGTGRDV